MGRFIKYLILNVAGLGVVGWMQLSLFDWDGLRTSLGSFGSRSGGYSAHK
ncbi:MAG: hypothetical protein AB7G13_26460 [Lautropia sp.]